MTDIGHRGAAAAGAGTYCQFRHTLQRLIDELRRQQTPRPDRQPATGG